MVIRGGGGGGVQGTLEREREPKKHQASQSNSSMDAALQGACVRVFGKSPQSLCVAMADQTLPGMVIQLCSTCCTARSGSGASDFFTPDGTCMMNGGGAPSIEAAFHPITTPSSAWRTSKAGVLVSSLARFL